MSTWAANEAERRHATLLRAEQAHGLPEVDLSTIRATGTMIGVVTNALRRQGWTTPEVVAFRDEADAEQLAAPPVAGARETRLLLLLSRWTIPPMEGET